VLWISLLNNDVVVVLSNEYVCEQVFHGWEHAIQWLQRDFGLYVINCFDTFQAAKLLNYPSLSLAHVVKIHCGMLVLACALNDHGLTMLLCRCCVE
jgi:ribonuclease D